jgi:hypothetical protein
MNRSKFDKLSKEFPFIEKTVLENDAGGLRLNIQYLDYIHIGLASPVLLGRVPKGYEFPGRHESIDSIIEWEQVHFVLKDGTIIRNVVHARNIYRDHVDSSLAETIFEAVKRYNNIVYDLQFIVVTEGGYNIFRNRSMPNFRATIYKLKNGTTYSQLMNEAEEASREWEKYYYYNPYGFSC